jgi:hypothetical protein
MITKSLLVIGVYMLSSGLLLAETSAPQFKDYPVVSGYKGTNAPLILTRDDQMYRTRLRGAARNKPNFAGHYILATWGCGAECVMGAVVDANTGKVYWLPGTICCWGFDVSEKFEPIQFRLDSRLVMLSGERNEKEGDNGVHFYDFKGNKFVHVESIMKDKK